MLTTTVIHAQTPEPWSKPVNLSLSGSASQPVIGLGRNGAAHALWWDQIDGARYARGVVTGTQTTWGRTVAAPTIFSDRQIDSVTGRATLTPPSGLNMAVDGAGAAHAVWFARNNRLQYSQTQGNAWLTAQPLADVGLAASIGTDVTGTVRMAYVQSSSTAASPSGVYYATRAGGALRRTLVYSSTYFRTATPLDVNVSASADVSGTIVVAWNQAREEQSLYARSTDGGRTWSAPQPIVPRSNELGAAGRVSVTGVADGSLLLIWRDTSASGCGFTQRRSTDGGETWSAPERILPGLVRCPEDWTFGYSDDGKVWQLGFPEGETPLRNMDGSLAAWDGASWSKPVTVQFSYLDEASQRTRGLGCLNFSLAGQGIMLIGCDSRNDVWAAQNAVPLNGLLPVLSSPWSSPANLVRTITGRYASGGTRDLAIAAGAQDRTYAVWSQAEQAGAPGTPGTPGTALFASVLANGQWTDAAQIIRIMPSDTANADGQNAVKVDWPSLAVDSEDRLHVVWSGGSNGRIFYSSAFGRDANSAQDWSAPVPLPAATPLGGSADIVADPRGEVLYVAYVAPFNEGRGVYLTRSMDGGETWGQPATVFDAAAAGWDSLDAVRLGLDARNNTLHAVWLKTGAPGSTAPRAVYYTRSIDGTTWASPVKIAEGDITAPQIAVSDQTLALAWTSTEPASAESLLDAWFVVSPDGGANWAAVDRVPGMEGLTGRVSLIGDGAGRLYLVGAGRGPSGAGALLFTQWQGSDWSAVETNSLGQAAEDGNYAVAALNAGKGELGAVLRVQALQADGLSVNIPLGMFRTVVPAKLTPLPTFTPVPTETPPPTATPAPTVPPTVALATTSPASASSASQAPSFILLAGGLVVLVIIVGAVISFRLRRRR